MPIIDGLHPRSVDRPRITLAISLPITLLLAGLVSTQFAAQPAMGSGPSTHFTPVFQRGISYTAWSPEAYDSLDSTHSLGRMMQVNAEWVAICVWWFQDDLSSTEIRPRPDLYTASNDSVMHAIGLAQSLGLKVMLKPMVDVVDQPWRGVIPSSPEWFSSYRRFIYYFADMAEAYDVELLCVGCEFDANDVSTDEWREIVSGIRSRYSGPLTYAASPGHVQEVSWWDDLDYIGIDAYYPLTDGADPTLAQLVESWVGIADAIETWQATIGKQVIFTEIGYRSGDGSNAVPFAWWGDLAVDLEEQAECYDAALSVLWNRSWFYGFYWWNWETNPRAGGESDDGYTPQNKPAEGILAEWYARDWENRASFPVGDHLVSASLMILSLAGVLRRAMTN